MVPAVAKRNHFNRIKTGHDRPPVIPRVPASPMSAPMPMAAPAAMMENREDGLTQSGNPADTVAVQHVPDAVYEGGSGHQVDEGAHDDEVCVQSGKQQGSQITGKTGDKSAHEVFEEREDGPLDEHEPDDRQQRADEQRGTSFLQGSAVEHCEEGCGERIGEENQVSRIDRSFRDGLQTAHRLPAVGRTLLNLARKGVETRHAAQGRWSGS